MNKTISVNIGGRVFNIEERAFDVLNRYLAAIRSYFEGNDSTDEIISDIELRLAELFHERLTDQKQVITEADVQHVMSVMGKPEEFGDDKDETHSATGSGYQRHSKRVFRDPDNKIVAGVCGGLGTYLGWDPLILRLLFVIMFIFWGTGILIYIILALVIPMARTTAEKLQMRGEPVTVENISRKVSESFDEVKEDIKDFGKKNNITNESARGFASKLGELASDLVDFLVKVITMVFTILGKAIGVVLFFGAMAGIIAIVALFLGLEFGMGTVQSDFFSEDLLRGFSKAVFANETQRWLFMIGALLTLLIPMIAILLLAGRILFSYRRIPAYSGIILLTLWFIGISLSAVTGIILVKEFQIETSVSESLTIAQPEGDVLYVGAPETDGPIYKFRAGFGEGHFFYKGDVTFPGLDSTDIVYIGRNQFTVALNSTDSLYRLDIQRAAHGATQKDAVMHTKAIETREVSSGDNLTIFPYFALMEGQKIRNQQVKYVLSIPVGKKVHFNSNAHEIMHDVPNITNTLDSDMVGKTWVMTNEGLALEGYVAPMTENEKVTTY